MKIRFLSTNRFNEKIFYEFDGMKVKASCEGKEEEIDFGPLEDGKVQGHQGNLSSVWMRWAKKEDGEVYLFLYQKCGAGHWQHYSDWIDSSDYDDSVNYLKELDAPDQNVPEFPMEYTNTKGNK